MSVQGFCIFVARELPICQQRGQVCLVPLSGLGDDEILAADCLWGLHTVLTLSIELGMPWVDPAKYYHGATEEFPLHWNEIQALERLDTGLMSLGSARSYHAYPCGTGPKTRAMPEN